MQRPCDFIVLLESWAASQYLGQPKLANGALHMADLALWRSRRSGPLGWLATNTAHHVGMGESLGSSLVDFWLVHLASRLGNARVQRRSPVGNDEVLLVTAGWS